MMWESLVKRLILEHKGTFEKKRINHIGEYRVYGITVKRKPYCGTERFARQMRFGKM